MKVELIGKNKVGLSRREQQFKAGQSTLEIIIALGIIITGISAAIIVVFSSQSSSVDTKLSHQAVYLAKQQLESARATARENFASLVNSSSSKNGFSLQTLVENVDVYTKRVTTTVSWQVEQLRPRKIELTAVITDWKIVVEENKKTGGDTGGGGTSGNWKSPQTLGSIDLGAGNQGADLDVINKIVYMAANASDVKKGDFYIVDATNGSNPFVRSYIDTGPGLLSLDATVNYAYVGNSSTTKQLQIIDTSNLNNPILITSFTLPDVSGSGALGNSIFFYDDKVYMGTKKAEGPELHIIDVSDPYNPVSVGSKEIGEDVNAIYVKNNKAYIATPSNSEELKIFDVSNPANITQIGSFDAPGGTEDGKSLYLTGNILYLGRTGEGGHEDHHEFHILDVTIPSSTQSLGSKDLAADLNDLRVRDTLAFLGTSDSNKEFQVWDISNPAQLTLLSSFNFPQVATGVDYEDNLIYVSVRSNDALRIITSQ